MRTSSGSPHSGFDSGSDSDLRFARRLLAGDEAAFERFFDVAYPALYRFALARIDFDHDAAGDIAQTALCKAIAKLGTFKGEAALLTWLCTFCRRELYAFRKQRGAHPSVELIEDHPAIRAALESLQMPGGEDPGAALDRSRTASLVQNVLDHLPPRYASALEWKYIDDLSVIEIGVRLGIGSKAAESLLTRARQAFRDAFHAYDPGPGARLHEVPDRG